MQEISVSGIFGEARAQRRNQDGFSRVYNDFGNDLHWTLGLAIALYLCYDDLASGDIPSSVIMDPVIAAYPEFRCLYEEVYEMCRNLERVMEMYSKELQELDRNTVQYMIDEMQETINQMDAQLSRKDDQLSQKDDQLNRKDAVIDDLSEELSQLRQLLEEQNLQIRKLRSQAEQGSLPQEA